MKDLLAKELEKLLNEHFSEDIVFKFRQRLPGGNLTKHENPQSHFCVYFAACDYKAKQFFIGHHKKSGLWLFNGGHIDKDETVREAVGREINEEWGLDIGDLKVEAPALLTVTDINNPAKQPCRLHFDIWHFINVNKDDFKPDSLKLSEEFYFVEWMDKIKIKQVATDKNTLAAIDFIESNYFLKTT